MNATFTKADGSASAFVDAHRTDDLYRSPGRWNVRLRVWARDGRDLEIDPAEARAIAQQLLAVAEDVERLRKREER